MHSVKTFLRKFFSEVGTSRALGLKMALDADDWTPILGSKVRHPDTYLDHHEYFDDACVVDIARKLRLPGDSRKRIAAAQQLFFQSERSCKMTNVRLERFISNRDLVATDMPVFRFIDEWRKNLRRALGSAPWVIDLAFSAGSTLSDKGCLTTIPDKMSSDITVYPRSVGTYAYNARNTILSQRPLVVADSNLFFTVPKDSEKDRGCCIEASGSLSLQLAVGKILKSRYEKRYGVDLRYAKPIQMALARQGSMDGSLATIDLSNASDTVAKRLCQLILPEDWYALLNSLRADFSTVDGKRYLLEKFSSMGNGFTFELETFIFRTMAETLGSDKCHCFGDDIIIETDLSTPMVNCLEYFGFTPNPKKTFCEGPFRESCGGDYYNGKAVRPHFLEELPDEPQKWIALANGVRRLDPMLLRHRASWRFCVDQVPISWRNFGPEWLGDLLFWDPDAAPQVRPQAESGYATYYACQRPVYRSFDLEKYWAGDVVIAASCFGVDRDVTPRGDIIGYRRTNVLAYGSKPQWLLDYLSKR